MVDVVNGEVMHVARPGKMSACPVCRSEDLAAVTAPSELPALSCTLWPDRRTALSAPRGTMSLALCRTCGILVNVAFDPSILDYDAEYENSLHYSPLFREYAQQLAVDLVERHDLHQKVVLEIGCGKGDFLRMLVELGDNQGFGFDPAYEHDPGQPLDERLHFVKEYYSGPAHDVRPDLIIARQFLEHVDDPLLFLRSLREGIGDGANTALVLEVPNALDMLERMDVWDVIYEHPIYFTPQALENVLRSAGFEVDEIRPVYENLYLIAEATPGAADSEHTSVESELEQAATRFAEGYQERLDRWRSTLADIRGGDLRAVLWGAGARGDTFLNAVGASADIPLAIDINPRKWGKHMAGTGQLIAPPDALMDDPPDIVVIANEIYREEIEKRLADMGIVTEILVA